MSHPLEELREGALAEIAAAPNEPALDAVRVRYLGRSGSILASAPNMQSTMRKPVRPRAAQAAGKTPCATVPAGAVTLIARETPSLGGMFCGRIERMPQ